MPRLDRQTRNRIRDRLQNRPADPTSRGPQAVPYWRPGTLYQPGDLVQPNRLNATSLTAVTNGSFESGDTAWTKGTAWSIGTEDAFKGTYSAKYAGQPSDHLFIPYDNSGTNAIARTSLGSGYADKTDVTFPTETSGLMMAANSEVAVAVAYTQEGVAYRSTDGGETWASATTAPPLSGGNIHALFWDSATELFYAFTNSAYATSPDGDVWTLRTAITGQTGVYFHGVTKDDTLYVFFSDEVHKTTDGINWTAVDTSLGFFTNVGVVKVGSTYLTVYNRSSSQAEVYTSTDLETWTAAANSVNDSLEAALGTWSTVDMYIATDGDTVVISKDGLSASADNVARSTDGGTTWASATTATKGRFLHYAEALGYFIKIDANFSTTDAFDILYSADGDTWSSYELFASGVRGEGDNGWPRHQDFTTEYTTLVQASASDTIPSQIINATAMVKTAADGYGKIGIRFYDSGGTTLETVYGDPRSGASSYWCLIEIAAVAPLDTASAAVVLAANGEDEVFFDLVQWDHVNRADFDCFVYEATQSEAGHSDDSEPTWPTTAGNTVTDDEVTWTAREGNCVVWEAKPILISGSTEPSWPPQDCGGVEDGTILWVSDTGRVKDENCPNTKVVAIAASKIFCGDDDIIAYSATVNPLDWSAPDDAGYLPFGLNTYGSGGLTALGIYRSNLVAWNAKAFQMWQVDEDPQNMALLDAIPVGNRFYKSASPVSNDLVWLTDEGIRNMGIAGASNNLQAGFFGKQIDPLVLEAIGDIADEDDILSLYYPGAGQYWIIFGDEAFVLTMNGGKSDMSWSRYTFPSAIDDYTIKDGELYLRSGDKVWLFDEDAVQDDVGGTATDFEGRVWWHYLDFGALGITKSMIGFDVVATGTFNVAIGYDQNTTATATDDYELTGDTLPNGVIPLPVTAPSFQLRLTWSGGEAWKWNASALYLQDWRITS